MNQTQWCPERPLPTPQFKSINSLVLSFLYPRPRELRAFFSCMAWRAIPGPLSKRKRRLDSLEATQWPPRDPRRGSRGERSPLLPLEVRPDSPGVRHSVYQEGLREIFPLSHNIQPPNRQNSSRSQKSQESEMRKRSEMSMGGRGGHGASKY